MINKETLRGLPKKTGVYIMKDAAGHVLYVGKALNLRRRVSSYFSGRVPSQPLVRAVAPKASDIDYILTDTEKEALLLEDSLIKEHRPRYNIQLKDDKTYAHIRITVNEEYPRLEVVRRPQKGGSRCFGPYSSAEAARKTVRFLQRIFRLRDCSLAEFSRRERPCIKYQIKRCCAPCCARVGEKYYGELVKRVILFLSGKADKLLRLLDDEMRKEAGNLNYEKAKEIRNTIFAIRKTLEHQKSVAPDAVDRDAVGLYREGKRGEAAILCVRGGKLIARRGLSVAAASGDDSALISGLLVRHYKGGAFIPPEILLPSHPEDREAIESLLSEERGGRVRLRTPRRGDKKRLVKMAGANAEAAFKSRRGRDLDMAEQSEEMRRRFRLPSAPRTIECVDISNMGGAEAVGSLVVYKNGVPVRDDYRRFSIKSVHGADDCGMIYELVGRRIRRGVRDGNLPDLIVVDGGKGQLHAAVRAVREAEAKGVAIIAIAKEREHDIGRKPDRVFIEGRREPIPLKGGDRVALFLQGIRDEAHRVAVCHHRQRRRRQLLDSELMEVIGIGEKRKRLLLREFGGIKGVVGASVEKLKGIIGDGSVARRIYARFHRT